MFYVFHFGKKLYFSKKLDTEEKVLQYYRGLLLEQDQASPHRYCDKTFQVEKGDVVLDVGAAEGNFSLEVLDQAAHIYIIEADINWVEALNQTFRDYKEKVTIIHKYASSEDRGMYATLDQLISQKIDFLKMDIEGFECDALEGARRILSESPGLKCAICAYHSDFDEMLIKKLLEECGMRCSTTPGYMWWDGYGRKNYVSTKLVRGIVRGRK